MPAERARGCVFAEKFESATHVARNRGTVVESAPGNVKIDFGVTLPGVNGNYVLYPCGSLLNKAVLNFVIEFWPAFVANDWTEHRFFSTPVGTEYLITHDAVNNLRAWFNATLIADVAYAAYSPYWLISQRNVLVLTTMAGNNSMYLNGNSISSSAAAWALVNPATMYIGASPLACGTFRGIMTSFKIFTGQTSADLLTQAEAADYYHQRVF
jgi:hypothetical protein